MLGTRDASNTQARDQEVGEARMQLARLIRELEGARGEGERMLRRIRALEGQEQVNEYAMALKGCRLRHVSYISVALQNTTRRCGRRRRRP